METTKEKVNEHLKDQDKSEVLKTKTFSVRFFTIESRSQIKRILFVR